MCLKYLRGMAEVPFMIPTPLQIKIYTWSRDRGGNRVMTIDEKRIIHLRCCKWMGLGLDGLWVKRSKEVKKRVCVKVKCLTCRGGQEGRRTPWPHCGGVSYNPSASTPVTSPEQSIFEWGKGIMKKKQSSDKICTRGWGGNFQCKKSLQIYAD